MSDEELSAAVRKLFKGGGIVLLGLVLELGISFVGKLLVAPYLGRYDYGAVSLGITTAAITSTIVLLGINTGIGRYLPRFEEATERRGVLVSGFQMVLPLAILAGGGIYLLAPTLANVFASPPETPRSSLVPVFRLFALAVPFGAVMKLAIGSAQGVQQTVPRVAIQNVTFPVVRFGGLVAGILLGAGVYGISLAYVASYVVAGLVGLYYVATRTSLFDRSVSYEAVHQKLLTFSLPLVVTAAMTIVLSDIDMYMLGVLTNTGVVGEYNVVYPLAQLLTSALGAFGFLFMPVVSELDAAGEHERIRRLFQVVTKWIVIATLPVFLVMAAFPRWTILLTFGEEYVGGSAALAVLATGFFIHTVFGLNKGALTSLGRTRLIMFDDITAAVVNVLLNLVLIPEYGLVGAAWATTLSYLLLNVLYSYQLFDATGVHPFTVSVLKPVVIAVASMGGLYLVARSFLVIRPLTLVGLFVLFAGIYGVVVLRFGIEEEEVMLVLSFEERFGVDLGPLKTLAERFM